MKNYILYVLLAFTSIVLAQTPTQTKNYIMTKTYQKGYVKGQEQNATAEEKIATIQYIDGLGRPIQNVGVRAGGQSQDIISFIDYDILGRQAIDYLPYTATSTGGSYRTNGLNATNSFYNTTKYGNTTNPYSEKHFEASPLNRIVEQSAPGGTWLLNKSSDTDHTIKFNYESNIGSDVKKYTVSLSFANNTYIPTLQGGSSYYGANELYKTITKDENWKAIDGNNRTTHEFKDKQGRVLLKRTFNASASHDTYYVYDDYGNLSYVLPPKAEPQSAKPDTTELSELCYQYKYDNKNRLVEKKIPGKDWEYIIYDKLDRPILTQDGSTLLRGGDNWLFTKYDAFSRVTYTGLYWNGGPAPQSVMQDYVDNVFYANPSAKNYEEKSLSGPIYNYTNQSFPTPPHLQIHTLNYYDNYTFDKAGLIIPSTSYGVSIVNYNNAASTSILTRGLSTGTKVKVLEQGENWITTVHGYDNKGRAIWVGSYNSYLQTTDILESKLDDFTGRVLETKSTHKKTGKTDIVTIDRFEYDHTGRVLTQTQDISNAVSRRLVKNNYDDLGQLESKLIDNGTQDGYKDLVGVSVTNDIITKTGGSSWGSGGLATKGNFANNGYVEYQVPTPQARLMVGLSNSNSNANYNTIKYAIYNEHSANFKVYESGSYKGVFGTYTSDDIFRVERIGTTIYYKKNGKTFYTSTVASTGSLLGDISIFYTNKQIKDLKIVDNTKGLQKVDYKYNVRGWLTDINDVNSLGDDLFTFNIRYDNPSSGTALYNGNISQTFWKTKNIDQSLRNYRYSYDALNRIESANGNVNRYDLTNVDYDKNGNITRLDRRGAINSTATSFGGMDVIFYTYHTASNKLRWVVDYGNDDYGFVDGHPSGTDYTYDTNGNMKTDANKGITNITYNHLNLPTAVTINGQNISYIYDAIGAKLRKTVNGTTTDYAGNYVYENGNLQFFNHAEGYVTPSGSSFKYVYQYKDHLGNIRLSYNDADGSGTIATSEIIEENNYYPFGLKHKGYNTVVNSNGNSVGDKRKFGGNELQDELGLEWYDITARNYDPALGRWMNLDKMSEDYYSYTPYNYAGSSPLRFKDEDGNIIRDSNGNIVYTTSGSTVKTGPQPVDRVRHANGSVTVTYIDRSYAVGNIYADNGTAVEAYSLANATQTTVTYDKNGKAVSSNTSSVDQSRFDCKSDCHGKTFTDNRIWINNDQVETILQNDDYLSTSSESLADIAIFEENGQVVHSAVRNSNGTYDDNAGVLTTETGRTLKEASRGLTSGLSIANSSNNFNGNVNFFFKTSPDKVINDKRLNNLGTEKNGVRKISDKKDIAAFFQILKGN